MTQKEEKKLTIRESIHGNFYYHIAKDGIPLCNNKNTMTTHISLSFWGIKTHLSEKYCSICDKIFSEGKNNEEFFEVSDLDKLTEVWEKEHPKESKRIVEKARTHPIELIKSFFRKYF